MPGITRRSFAKHAAASTLFAPALLGATGRTWRAPVRLAVIGLNDRGSVLARGFATLPDVHVATLCDVDRDVLERAGAAFAAAAPTVPAPQHATDLRTVFDDADIDAVVIAMPDHWHAPATLLACAAGKHVYVEKPCSHSPDEGERMVAAAAKHGRIVQVGTQRRSRPVIRDAIARVHDGALGRVDYARAWYANGRPSIGHGKPASPPATLDWDLWQGPAPRRPFIDNVVHYNWHWRWHWGTGELGNNGVHGLDLCRFGLRARAPARVTSTGARHRFADDWECPDTQLVTYELPDAIVTWEGLSCSRYGIDAQGFGVSFHGELGTLVIGARGWRRLDPKNQVVEQVDDPDGDLPHLANFVAAIRGEAPLNAPIEEGHLSTLWCQLGNIAHRVGRPIVCDPTDGHITADPAAMALWTRDYEPGWAPAD